MACIGDEPFLLFIAFCNGFCDPVGKEQDYKKENQNNEVAEGVRMLFYGLSGTGKTELARYISTTLGKPLLLKRCSDLLGPFVGQTEQLIASAFEEAESTDSMLSEYGDKFVNSSIFEGHLSEYGVLLMEDTAISNISANF